jgi:hypothetical protein
MGESQRPVNTAAKLRIHSPGTVSSQTGRAFSKKDENLSAATDERTMSGVVGKSQRPVNPIEGESQMSRQLPCRAGDTTHLRSHKLLLEQLLTSECFPGSQGTRTLVC